MACQLSAAGYLCDRSAASPQDSAQTRAELERFIHQVYAHRYGADLCHFMPALLGARDGNGDIRAAVGLRGAADTPLFLECYLDAPVEQVLRSSLGLNAAAVRRSDIVEIGNLAALQAGDMRQLVAALSRHLQEAGYRWAVFTATRMLYNTFTRLDLAPVALAEASPDRLPPTERDHWGSYYRHRPKVFAGNVAYGYQAIQALSESDSGEQLLIGSLSPPCHGEPRCR